MQQQQHQLSSSILNKYYSRTYNYSFTKGHQVAIASDVKRNSNADIRMRLSLHSQWRLRALNIVVTPPFAEVINAISLCTFQCDNYRNNKIKKKNYTQFKHSEYRIGQKYQESSTTSQSILLNNIVMNR